MSETTTPPPSLAADAASTETPPAASPGEYTGHDELGEHMPVTQQTLARYERTRLWRDRFRADAEHYSGPCPDGADPALWEAHRHAAASMADDLDKQLRAMDAKGLTA